MESRKGVVEEKKRRSVEKVENETKGDETEKRAVGGEGSNDAKAMEKDPSRVRCAINSIT